MWEDAFRNAAIVAANEKAGRMAAIQYAIERVSVDVVKRDPDNARTSRDESRIVELANDLKANGLICPRCRSQSRVALWPLFPSCVGEPL